MNSVRQVKKVWEAQPQNKGNKGQPTKTWAKVIEEIMKKNEVNAANGYKNKVIWGLLFHFLSLNRLRKPP